MDRARRIWHRGWLRKAISVFSFGYYPVRDDDREIPAKWLTSIYSKYAIRSQATSLYLWISSVSLAEALSQWSSSEFSLYQILSVLESPHAISSGSQPVQASAAWDTVGTASASWSTAISEKYSLGVS